MPIRKNCELCGKEFFTKPYLIKMGHGRFCSKSCARTGVIREKKPKLKFICNLCKKEFYVFPSRIPNVGVPKYCSRKCYSDIPKSKKTRRKMSLSGKGKRMGKERWNWKDGRPKHSGGYIYILQPNHPFCDKNSHIFEHRIVMEQWLRKYHPNHPALIEIKGIKYLRPEWVVHHINNIRDDNRIENLGLFENMYFHSKHHAKKYYRNKNGRFTNLPSV